MRQLPCDDCAFVKKGRRTTRYDDENRSAQQTQEHTYIFADSQHDLISYRFIDGHCSLCNDIYFRLDSIWVSFGRGRACACARCRPVSMEIQRSDGYARSAHTGNRINTTSTK